MKRADLVVLFVFVVFGACTVWSVVRNEALFAASFGFWTARIFGLLEQRNA